MKLNLIIISLLFILLSTLASASSPYGSMDVFYNDELLPGKEIAKPTLKIGEPFNVKIEMTLNQTCTLFFQICSLDDNFFEVVDGPSEFQKTKYMKSLEPGTYVFEWKLRPTEEWAGGSIPLNYWYQINLPGQDESVLNSEFTVAYCYISTEYYEGKVPSSDTSPSEPLSSPNSTSSESIPAFTLLAAVFAITLISFRH